MNGHLAPLPTGKRSDAIRVLIVDDSALVRRILSDALSGCPDIEVVGTASDPYVARERIVELRPDVITLDIEMPRMDGLSFLSKIMMHFPLPVIVVSSLAREHSDTAVRALALGAVDVIAKPGSSMASAQVTDELIRAVRAAASARVTHFGGQHVQHNELREHVNTGGAAAVQPKIQQAPSQQIIAIGASTGGTQALEQLLTKFPADAPGTVVVQHMPEHFTRSFANRLDRVCAVHVQEARDCDVVRNGLALVAPGGKHLVVQREGAHWVVRVKDGPKIHHQRPAVDVLFQSVARSAGRQAVAALLTGMGADGAKGLLAMRDVGAHTIAQDEASCVVYGMPREAVKLGAAIDVLPLDRIARALLRAATPENRAETRATPRSDYSHVRV